MSDNKEKSETVDELCGSARDIRNYNERYYVQQIKNAAIVTAVAMLRDNIPPADVRICIDDWYDVKISEHTMTVLQDEATDDEANEALTGERVSTLSPSLRHYRCNYVRKAKRMHERGVSPDIIYYVYPELSKEEIDRICSKVDNNSGTKVDNLTLRRLQEAAATPLKTTAERVAYLKGRSDKAREVIQDLYCNHGGNAHSSVYDFFQDDIIGYEEIVAWKQEAADCMERHLASRLARRTAVQMLQDGVTPNEAKENIDKWFSISFTAAQMIALRRQANLNKCMSEMTVELEKGKHNV